MSVVSGSVLDHKGGAPHGLTGSTILTIKKGVSYAAFSLVLEEDLLLPVQHFGTGSFQLLKYLRKLGVVIVGTSPAKNAGKVVSRAQRQYSQLTLKNSPTADLRHVERQGLGHFCRLRYIHVS